jgi:hypothetical protein
MTVRLERHSLLLGLVAALGGIGAVGCGSAETQTALDPEGNPRILQVFVRDRAEGFKMTYGVHWDLNLCGYDKDQCPEGFSCADSGELAGHCVDAQGNQPRVENAIVSPPQMRIISKELLDGRTIEQFLCSCGAGCPEGQKYSIDPYNCSSCGDNPTTPEDETGRCLDNDDDTLADFAALQPGIATITCGAALTYTTGINDGFYYPSGNQFPTSASGTNGLGPAIVLHVTGEVLPTNTECTVALTDKARDKDGNAFDPTPSPITFRTERLTAVAAGRVPAAGAMTVPATTAMLVIPFNTRLLASTVNNTNVKLAVMGGAEIAVTPALAANQTTITVPLPAGTLQPDTTYEVTITTGVQDKFGQALPAEVKYTFKTAAAM